MNMGEIGIKILVWQLVVIGLMWIGMLTFYNEMDSISRFVFYIVTSWLLYLIVVTIIRLLRQKKEGK